MLQLFIQAKRDTDLPVCHLLPVPAEGVVRRSGLAAAQRLPETTVEGAEALQAGYELPEVQEKRRECSTQRKAKNENFQLI